MIIIVKQNFRNVISPPMNVPKNVRSPLALSRFMEIDFPSGRTVPRSCLLGDCANETRFSSTIYDHLPYTIWNVILDNLKNSDKIPYILRFYISSRPSP